jgi:hypothetical protein
MPLYWGWNRWMAHQWVMSVANDGRYGRVFMEYSHMRKHIRHIADTNGRNEFVGNQNPAVEFPPTLLGVLHGQADNVVSRRQNKLDEELVKSVKSNWMKKSQEI